MEIAVKRGLKVAIVTHSQSAADNVINIIADSPHATVCTFANVWREGMTDWIIVDHAQRMTEAQLVQIWRNRETLLLIGDQTQPGPRALTKPKENPFVEQYQLSLYIRFLENNWSYFMLEEVLRMTAGLEVISSELFYGGQLKPGPATSLFNATRCISRIWQHQILLRYPSLTKEPKGLVYPVFINIEAESEAEPSGGHSRINLYNASAVVDHIIWVVESAIALPGQIGIATPYAGQIRLIRETIRKLQADKPEHGWHAIRLGTAEWWKDRQADYMIVDLVRASNDGAELGFVSRSRRLNVLLSRQRQALVIVGDKHCIKPIITGDEVDDTKDRNYENGKIIKMLEWMQENGRLVEVPLDSVSRDYVKLGPSSSDDSDAETVDPSGRLGLCPCVACRYIRDTSGWSG